MNLLGFYQGDLTKLLFWVTAAAFLIEQIFYWFLGSYPYRYGISFKLISNPIHQISTWRLAKGKCSGLAVRINEKREEVYLRYKYPLGIIGPLLFVGQIRGSNVGTLRIRIGPFCAIFMIYLFIGSIISLRLFSFFNFLVIAGLVVWFYFRFLNSYNQCRDNLIVKL